MTNRPLQDRWGKAAEQFTPIPWILLQKSGNCPPFKGVDVKLTAPQQLLLIQLISYWWPKRKGHPFPSYSALSIRTGMTKKTIGSHLVQLEKKGWLKRIKRWQAGNNYSGWFYDLDPTVRRLAWLTNLPQEKEQIPEEAEAPSMHDGLLPELEEPVEVMPEPAAPLCIDHLRIVKPDPDLTAARLKILSHIKRLGRAEQVTELSCPPEKPLLEYV